ncbi:hypothetical protein V5O48_005390 [Marasmius crinis-equi]|uniref:Thioesterase domain-containing protein n=1 Tax=Marasmius crinis-equi TaxID=585013 RepID=A0ABR3FMF9_9AGAR
MVSTNSDSVDISSITGDAPDHVKAFLADPTTLEDVSGQSQTVRGFGYDIIARMKVEEVSVTKKADEPQKLEGRVVVKMKVEQDMVHGGLHMHGGCSAFIIDTSVFLEGGQLSSRNSRNLFQMHNTGDDGTHVRDRRCEAA